MSLVVKWIEGCWREGFCLHQGAQLILHYDRLHKQFQAPFLLLAVRAPLKKTWRVLLQFSLNGETMVLFVCDWPRSLRRPVNEKRQ